MNQNPKCEGDALLFPREGSSFGRSVRMSVRFVRVTNLSISPQCFVWEGDSDSYGSGTCECTRRAVNEVAQLPYSHCRPPIPRHQNKGR